MSRRAWAFVGTVLCLGVILASLSLFQPPGARAQALDTPQWVVWGVLLVLCTGAHLIKALGPNHEAWHLNLVFLFAGVVLLSPALFALLVIVPHLVEWAKARLTRSSSLRAWYIQPFNIATHIIAGAAARWVQVSLQPHAADALSLSTFLAAMVALLAYLVANHVLIGTALVLARGLSWRSSGILDIENSLSDLALLCMGLSVALVWRVNPWLVGPTLIPLVLIARAMTIPQLKKEAQTDAKTGLLNAGRFKEVFEAELERARRFGRPLSVVMSDLDLLRNINNTYGHLAGDAVLVRIGEVIRDSVRAYDIAARFGGEEFAMVLPEVGAEQAVAFAERLRHAVEVADIPVKTSPVPLRVTISLGVAAFPEDAGTANGLIHAADMAVYQAKLEGRNRSVWAQQVPATQKGGPPTELERLAVPHVGEYHPRPQGMSGAPEASLRVPDALRTGLSQGIATAPAGAGQPVPSERSAAETPKLRRILLCVLVGSVIVLGGLAAWLGFRAAPHPDLLAIVMFALLGVLAELFEVDMYGESTISVTTAANFAAALVAGVPAVTVVGAVIALTHYVRRRPALYKTLFNWSIHILAGSVPALMIRFGWPVALEAGQLHLLLILTLLSGAAYYGIESGLISAVVAESQGAHILSTWRERYRWLWGHYIALCLLGLFLAVAYHSLGWVGVLVFVLPVLMMRYAQRQYIQQTKDSVQELKRMNQELAWANGEALAANQAVHQLNEELLTILAKIIDARDPYITGHTSMVSDYAVAVARSLGLSRERVENVRQAGFLHDIGKIAIPEQILSKPGPLTDSEYDCVKTHANIGAEFLSTSRGLKHLAPFVRHHHERWNGQGYPGRLRREQIPLEARILAVCDAAEAMASDRPYRPAMRLPEVLAELRRCAGEQFDPEIVQAFVGIVANEGAWLVANSADEVDARTASAYVHARALWADIAEQVGASAG